MSLIDAPEGIRIGGEDRLPMLDFDEWCPNSGVGVMSAGEIKTLTLTDMPTLKVGASLIARPLNPDQFNQQYLLISHIWVPEDGTVKIIVKNMSDQELDFGSDMWNLGGYRTVNG